jgi:hypothetical protein
MRKARNGVGKGSEKNDEAEQSDAVDVVQRWHTLWISESHSGIQLTHRLDFYAVGLVIHQIMNHAFWVTVVSMSAFQFIGLLELTNWLTK